MCSTKSSFLRWLCKTSGNIYYKFSSFEEFWLEELGCNKGKFIILNWNKAKHDLKIFTHRQVNFVIFDNAQNFMQPQQIRKNWIPDPRIIRERTIQSSENPETYYTEFRSSSEKNKTYFTNIHAQNNSVTIWVKTKTNLPNAD